MNIVELPPECLLNIFEYLDHKGLQNSSLVCKLFDEIVNKNLVVLFANKVKALESSINMYNGILESATLPSEDAYMHFIWTSGREESKLATLNSFIANGKKRFPEVAG